LTTSLNYTIRKTPSNNVTNERTKTGARKTDFSTFPNPAAYSQF